jgi:hypothetical protein
MDLQVQSDLRSIVHMRDCTYDSIAIYNVFDGEKNTFNCKKKVTLIINSLLDDNDINLKIEFIKQKNIESVKFSDNNLVLKSNDIINFINKLPLCVKYFTFNLYNSIVGSKCEYTSCFANLPIDLLYLELGSYCNFHIDMLPMGLKSLSLGYNFNKPLDNLPNGLELLYIEGIYNNTLDNLPDSITYLHLDLKNFTLPITKLPNSLVNLKVSLYFSNSNSDIIEYIFQNAVYPETLEEFEFSIHNIPYDYVYDISKLNFPKKLKVFIIGEPINTVLNKCTIPANTEILYLNRCYNLDNLLEMPDSVKKCYINGTLYNINGYSKKLSNARARCPNCELITNVIG